MDYLQIKELYHSALNNENELYHHGIKGMKWGVRRFQNEDGSLTEEGKKKATKQLGKNRYITNDGLIPAVVSRIAVKRDRINKYEAYKDLRDHNIITDEDVNEVKQLSDKYRTALDKARKEEAIADLGSDVLLPTETTKKLDKMVDDIEQRIQVAIDKVISSESGRTAVAIGSTMVAFMLHNDERIRGTSSKELYKQDVKMQAERDRRMREYRKKAREINKELKKRGIIQ